MRILMLLPLPLSQASRVHEEAESLVEAGNHVAIITWEVSKARPLEERTNGISVISIANTKCMNLSPKQYLMLPFWRQKAYLSAMELHKRNPFDIIHCVDVESLPLGVRIKRKIRVPLIYEARELFFDLTGSKFVRIGNRIIERVLLPDVSSVICPSDTRASAYTTRYKLHRPPAVVLNVPKSFTPEPSGELREGLRSILPDAECRKILLYAGGITPGRGLDKVIAEVKKFDDNIVLAIVGVDSPKWKKRLQRLIDLHGVRDRVALLPPVPRNLALRFMASADAGLVTYENVSMNNYLCTPRKMWELLHAGTPIIGSDLPEIARLVHECKIGMLFSWDVPGSLATAVNTLLTDADLCHVMSLRAKQAARNYCWEKESEELLAIYEGFRSKLNFQ
jgi:glycosyltransferase involved in cell wall biosynthesis